MNTIVRAIVIAIVAVALFSCSKETNPPTSATVIKPASVATVTPPPAKPEATTQVAPANETKPASGSAAASKTNSEPSKTMIADADSRKTVEYVVKKGDNLWKIAKTLSAYNDSYKWPLIYRANVGKIKDADLIRVGMKLKINLEPTDKEVKAAVAHAKTRGGWAKNSIEQSDIQYLSHLV